MIPAEADEVSFDTLLRGRVGLYQPTRGYRASLDPIWLAAFVGAPCGRFVDIGCGTGAVSFLLLERDPLATGVGIELQPRLADLASRGSVRNGFSRRLALHVGDVRTFVATQPFDLVVTNPPYRPLGTGLLPPDEERSIANHEVALTLAGWLDAAAALLAPGGRLCVVFPADRAGELRSGLRARGLEATRLRLVVPQAGQPPSRVLIEARRQGTLTVEPPLVVHADGRFTPEVRRMVGEED